MSNSKVVASYF